GLRSDFLSTSKMRWPTSSDARVTRSCSILRKEARSEALASTGSTLTPQTDHSQRSRRRWASLASWNTYRLPSSEDWRHWLPRPARRFSACFERSLITHDVNLVP